MAKKILIVDDEIFTLRLMEKKLSRDCIVEVATNAVEAQKLLRDSKYDAVILDVNLPDVSGLDILKQHKQDVSLLNHDTPFVMCSASVDYETISAAMEHKAFDYIIKSFHMDRLNDIMDSINSFENAKSQLAV
jgi:DNA-binding NtrC family response regulator